MGDDSRLVRVSVTTDARSESIKEDGVDAYTISVKEPASQNRANTRMLEILAIHIGVPKKNLRIIAGHHRPKKILAVRMV